MDQEQISVKYIGHRPEYVDGAYGTRIHFVQGESQMVHAAAGRKMLKHPDVYVPGNEKKSKPAVQTEVKEENDQDDSERWIMRDAIATMDKSALISHAKMHYNVTLGKNMDVQVMRTRVTGLFDQFGQA